MKTTRLTLGASLLVLALGASGCSAQAAKSEPAPRFASELALTDQQRDQIQALMQRKRNEQAERQASMREANRAAMRQELNELLTPEQMEVWEARKQNRDAKRQARSGRFAPERRSPGRQSSPSDC